VKQRGIEGHTPAGVTLRGCLDGSRFGSRCGALGRRPSPGTQHSWVGDGSAGTRRGPAPPLGNLLHPPFHGIRYRTAVRYLLPRAEYSSASSAR